MDLRFYSCADLRDILPVLFIYFKGLGRLALQVKTRDLVSVSSVLTFKAHLTGARGTEGQAPLPSTQPSWTIQETQ